MKKITIKLCQSNATGTARLDKQTEDRLNRGNGTDKIKSIAEMSDEELIKEGIRYKHVTKTEPGLYHKSKEDKKELKLIKANIRPATIIVTSK